MKKFTLMLVAMLVAFAANAWTVSFTNPNGWEEVCVYTFSPETCGTWPGAAMTKSGDVWTYEGTGTPAKIIFNNNNKGSQTSNLDFTADATYDMNGVVGAEMNEYTVYFENGANWSDVYVYTFSPEYFGGWPGTKIEKGADGLYVATVKATSEPAPAGIIFNNNNGAQTGDLKWETGKTYSFGGGDTPDNFDGWYVSLWAGEGDSMSELAYVQISDGVTTAKFENQTIGTKEFEIKVYDGANDHYYGVTTPVSANGEWQQFYENGGHATVQGASENSQYTVEFDLTNNMIKLTTIGTGVAAVEAANGEAVYFNMQGVRVANPENGLFIRVQNGKAVKVVK